MRLSARIKISFVALSGYLILGTTSLISPSLGQARAEERSLDRQPLAPRPLDHRHVRGSMIICRTHDVKSCHREFAHKHGGQPLHHE
jgi:hypothetical protein